MTVLRVEKYKKEGFAVFVSGFFYTLHGCSEDVYTLNTMLPFVFMSALA